jgi:light-regulated signal transduction histidine kinase (bacteriophytochrome)
MKLENLHVNTTPAQLVVSDRELVQFVYIASHNLQEPLRTISNFVRLLEEDYGSNLDDNAAIYLQIISSATTRMQVLIKDLLDYSRLGNSEHAEKIDCNRVVAEILSDLSPIISESHSNILVQPLPMITGYPAIKVLFQNLISNAIKFRKNNKQNTITISSTEDEHCWSFAIQDNGIGIEKEYFERIFVIFQKLHSHKQYPGSGIGLAQCKKVIELHRGQLWVESTPDKGSLFQFNIPNQLNV